MSPAERFCPAPGDKEPGTGQDQAGQDQVGQDHDGVGVRCHRCLEVLRSRHAFEHLRCSCGAVAVSGPPRRPRVRFDAGATGGWSLVLPDPEDEGGTEAAVDAAIACAPGAREPAPRRIGYR